MCWKGASAVKQEEGKVVKPNQTIIKQEARVTVAMMEKNHKRKTDRQTGRRLTETPGLYLPSTPSSANLTDFLTKGNGAGYKPMSSW